MKDSEKISVSIYHIILDVYNNIALPTHATLEKTFKWSLLLFACSVLSTITGFYTFISWYGAFTCSFLLGLFLFIERRQNDALLRMYSTVRVSAKEVVRRAKTASSSVSSIGSADNIGKLKEKVAGFRQSKASERVERPDGVSVRDTADSGPTVSVGNDESDNS